MNCEWYGVGIVPFIVHFGLHKYEAAIAILCVLNCEIFALKCVNVWPWCRKYFCFSSIFNCLLCLFHIFFVVHNYPKKNQSIKLKHEFIIWFNCFKNHVQNTSFTIKWTFSYFYHIAHWNACWAFRSFLIWKSTLTDSQLL